MNWNILRDLPNRSPICPNDLNPNESIDEIFDKYSTGNRYGKFTITDFAIEPIKEGLVELAEREALIDVQDIAFMSGYGHSLIYRILEDDFVEFVGAENIRMS